VFIQVEMDHRNQFAESDELLLLVVEYDMDREEWSFLQGLIIYSLHLFSAAVTPSSSPKPPISRACYKEVFQLFSSGARSGVMISYCFQLSGYT
jgi:hypothetical protein